MGVAPGPVTNKVCTNTKDACEVYMKKGNENGVTGIQTCTQYCQAYGMICVAQYDDNNNCVRGPKYPHCDVAGSTSDHFCHCGMQ